MQAAVELQWGRIIGLLTSRPNVKSGIGTDDQVCALEGGFDRFERLGQFGARDLGEYLGPQLKPSGKAGSSKGPVI
jgi:hypothetical protein